MSVSSLQIALFGNDVVQFTRQLKSATKTLKYKFFWKLKAAFHPSDLLNLMLMKVGIVKHVPHTYKTLP